MRQDRGDRTTQKLASLMEYDTAQFQKHKDCFVH